MRAFQPSDATEQGSSKQAIWHFCGHQVLTERNHNASRQTFRTGTIPTVKGLQPRSASQSCSLLPLANLCKGRRPSQHSSFTGIAYANCSLSAGSRAQKGGAAVPALLSYLSMSPQVLVSWCFSRPYLYTDSAHHRSGNGKIKKICLPGEISLLSMKREPERAQNGQHHTC